MSQEVSPSLSYHYWLACINDPESTSTPTPSVLIKGTDFDPQKEINREDDEGHTGTATVKISTYRSEATSTPSFKDKIRYKEGWEDILYLLTGSDDGSGNINKTEIATGVNKFIFSENPSNPQEPAFATLINGFAKTEKDAFLYLESLLNTFKYSGSNKDIPTYEVEFVSDYPHFRQDNPARVFPKKSIYPKASNVRLFIAPQGDYADLEAIGDYEYSCYEDWETNVNKNVEGKPCSGDEYGTSTKVTGTTEGDFSCNLPWNSKTKLLEYEYMGGDSELTTTTVTDEELHKTIWIVATGNKITRFSNSNTVGSGERIINTITEGNTTIYEIETGYNYQTIYKIPDVVVTNANSPQSGTDAKTLEFASDIVSNGVDPFIEVEVITGLSDLHISAT